MTEPMIVEQMAQVARVTGRPDIALPKMVPTLRWTIDITTGRPVALWIISEKHTPSALRPVV